MRNQPPVILVLHNDPDLCENVAGYLNEHAYEVLDATDVRQGLDICRSRDVDLILVDLQMPERGGLQVLSEVRLQDPLLPVVVIAAADALGEVVESLHRGASDFLIRPIDDPALMLRAIESALEKADQAHRDVEYRNALEARVVRQTEELTILNDRLCKVVETTRKLLGCGDIHESGTMILSEFARHMGAEGGSVYEVAGTRLCRIASLDGEHAAATLASPLPPESVFSRAMDAPEPRVIEDVHAAGCIGSGWQGYTSPCCMVFPFRERNGEIFAVLSLHNPKSGAFAIQDREIGSILASAACEALEAARAVTAMKRSEELMLQAQKLEAIGTLAGGIAHDFNNILSAILGYTDLSLFFKECPESMRHNLQQIKKAGQRAKDLVRQILAFSRVEESQVGPLNIRPIVKEALKLLRASLPASIAIEKSIPAELGYINADPGRIHQVLMNLCTNAAQAMQGREGVLRVECTLLDADPSDPRLAPLAGKKCLRLRIADTGHGMVPEVLGRIFNPYYTTKEMGEGTGLGLAVVDGIVRSSGGLVTVDSKPGEGSTFDVYFPSVLEEDDRSMPSADYHMPSGNERILFVDDEETLAELAGEMLRRLGYNVDIMTNSLEAGRRLEESAADYDLLITDQTMPGVSGFDLAQRAIACRADIPIILYSGYSAVVSEQAALEAGIRKVLMKPLSMTVLSQTVRSVLDGAAGERGGASATA